MYPAYVYALMCMQVTGNACLDLCVYVSLCVYVHVTVYVRVCLYASCVCVCMCNRRVACKRWNVNEIFN